MQQNDNPFITLLPQLTSIAEQYIKELNLTVGTYTALEIDRLLRKTIDNYNKESRQCLNGIKTIRHGKVVGKELDLYAGGYFTDNIITVSTEDLSLKFPLMAVFYILWKVEIYSGIKVKNRHSFTVKPVGNIIAEGDIELLTHETMKKLSRFINKDRRVTQNTFRNQNSYSININLKDGLLKFGAIANENTIFFSPQNFGYIENLESHLPPLQIRKLYGKCKIKVYSLSDQSYLVFENPDGTIISNYEFIMPNPDCPKKNINILSKPPIYLIKRLKKSPQIEQLPLF